MQEDNENYMQTHCLDSVAFVFAVVIGSLFVCIFLFLSFVNRKKNTFRLFETEVRFACTLILVIICHEHRKKKWKTRREKKNNQPTECKHIASHFRHTKTLCAHFIKNNTTTFFSSLGCFRKKSKIK